MKTITLTDSAYQRLIAWKETPRDSFSKVVERVVPPRGSLNSIKASWELLPTLSDAEAGTLQAELRAMNDWSVQQDPWTT